MANTSNRTLRLLSLLQSHRYWAGPQLAERLGVSVRTLRRDVDRLRELGYPVNAVRGVDGGYHLAAGASLPPLAVDDDEAVALALGLRAATQGGVTGIEDAALRALTKVMQVMPARLRQRVDTLEAVTVAAPSLDRGPRVDADVLTDVAQACRDEERLRFTYTTDAGAEAERHVEPHRLVPVGRRWYLVAFDLDRDAWRSFRLDRMSAPRSTGSHFRSRPLPAADAAAFVQEGLESQAPATIEARVEIRAPLAQVETAVGRWGQAEALGEGTTLLRMAIQDLDWVALVLGTLQADFHVLSPPELPALLAEWGARFTRCTATASPAVRK